MWSSSSFCNLRNALSGVLSLCFCANLLQAQAVQCPFETDGATLTQEGLVLTRYALGLRGAPLVANTSFAAIDAPAIESTIACPSCGLDINGNGSFDTTDAQIINRKLAGYSDNALTNGLNLGTGTRNTPDAVKSFLLAGCGTGGGANAWVNGGNAFGANSVIGTNDSQSLTIKSGGQQIVLRLPSGARVIYVDHGGNNGMTINAGSGGNVTSGAAVTLAGGGQETNSCWNWGTGASDSTCVNIAKGDFSFIGGGRGNAINSSFGTQGSVIAGGEDNHIHSGVDPIENSTIGGGKRNQIFNADATISGGSGNKANRSATVGGGGDNTASGNYSTVPGGFSNTAAGYFSFAAGIRAKANHDNSFVWGGSAFVDTQSQVANEFVVYAPGRVAMYAGPVGSGGCLLTGGSGWSCSSDEAAKNRIEATNPAQLLKKVIALPIKHWSYKADNNNTRNIGPMAQAFHKTFGVGDSDKTISAMNMSGVALAAIQGLNASLKDEVAKLKREANSLRQEAKAKEAKLEVMQRELAAIKQKLGL